MALQKSGFMEVTILVDAPSLLVAGPLKTVI
jgi:hypothetical protein